MFNSNDFMQAEFRRIEQCVRNTNAMKEIKIGDRVTLRGDTQHFILVNPDRHYKGKVIGKDGDQLLVSLDKPAMRGTVEFREVSVPESMVTGTAMEATEEP